MGFSSAAANPSRQSKQRPLADTKRKRGATCTHWLHSLPTVCLERDALDHLAECEDLYNLSPAEASGPCRPRTEASIRELRQKTESVVSSLPRLSLGSHHWRVPEEVKRFARQGGPDLSDLRGYPEQRRPVMGSHLSRHWVGADDSEMAPATPNSPRSRGPQPRQPDTDPTLTRTTSSSGVYHRNFETRMIQGGIYPDGVLLTDDKEQPEPSNLGGLQDMLALPRGSLSPSRFNEADFREFKQMHHNAKHSERRVVTKVLSFVQGTEVDDRTLEDDVVFNNLDNLLHDGKPYSPKPDRYYGTRPSDVEPRLRRDLNKHIVPNNSVPRPIAPNFFLEAKSNVGSSGVATRQLAMAGAAGARGMHSLQTYGGDDTQDYDNNAYTLSAGYYDGTLSVYSHPPAQPRGAGTRPEYYMHQLDAYSLTGSRRKAAEGIAAYRNAREWAQKQSGAIIERANAAARAADRAAAAAATITAAEDAVRGAEREGEGAIYAGGEADVSTSEQDDTPAPRLATQERRAG